MIYLTPNKTAELQAYDYSVISFDNKQSCIVFLDYDRAEKYLTLASYIKLTTGGAWYSDKLGVEAKLEKKQVIAQVFGLVLFRLAEYETYLKTKKVNISFKEWDEAESIGNFDAFNTVRKVLSI